MKRLVILAILFSIFLVPGKINASHDLVPSVSPQVTVNNILTRFRHFREFKNIEGKVPQVVEVELPSRSAVKTDFVLVEDETTSLQPFEIISKEKKPTYQVFWVNNNNQALSDVYLSDNNMNTFYEFPLARVGSGESVVLRFVYTQPIISQTFSTYFSPDGGNPTSVTLKAIENGTEKIIFAERQFLNGVFFFPKHSASVWEVTLNHAQPLRMLEASFSEEVTYIGRSQYIRFLMRPGSPYILFSSPDSYVTTPYLESGNLTSVTEVLNLPLPQEFSNPLYKPADDDADGVVNTVDNCPSIANKDQVDINKNKVGDVCDDFDTDGLMNSLDNCPEHPNRGQQDKDGDKKGDHCDDEESRITERLGFLPWLGIALGFAVVIGIFAITVKKPISTSQKDNRT